jgi:hypothetical protein
VRLDQYVDLGEPGDGLSGEVSLLGERAAGQAGVVQVAQTSVHFSAMFAVSGG